MRYTDGSPSRRARTHVQRALFWHRVRSALPEVLAGLATLAVFAGIGVMLAWRG